MAHLSLSFFGPFHVVHDGKVITAFRSVKNQALLAWLTLESKRPVSRASVAGLCWPDLPEESARLNFRQALFQLRSLLQGDGEAEDQAHLLVNTQSVQFNPNSDHTADVLEFNTLFEACAHHAHPAIERCAECCSRLRQAVRLYRGEFLQGMFVNDSPLLEEWISWRRQQYQQHTLMALHTLTSRAELLADYDQAEQYAQQQLAIDNLREEAYQQLMRARMLMGRRQEALVAYELCRKALKDELDVAPSTATQQLYEQIKHEQFGQTQFLASDRKETVAVPKISNNPLHNLPPAPNRFIGRQQELQTIQQRLRDPDCRFVTILGPGGVGKSRFVLALAQQILDAESANPRRGDESETPNAKLQNPEFPDGVWFTALAGVSNVLQLPQAIAASLGARLEGRSNPRQELFDYLRPKQLLLVLDNYEHLMADAALVDEILQAAPAVKIVVTSRERLNFQKERTLELHGLPFPKQKASQRSKKQTPAQAMTVAEIEGGEDGAVRLFLDRLQQLSYFELTPENLWEIQRICQLVEGYPLGIELAAALVSIMPLPEIADEIASGIDVLATTMGDIPDRHRSLRVVFDSSWERLRSQEKLVMARLSIFRGGFDWSAAQAIAQSTRHDLAGLIGKSMLSLNPSGRYAIHELLRQYAEARLENSSAVAHDHARYFAEFVYARQEGLMGGAQKETLNALNGEIENLRVAWRWAVENADTVLLQRFCRGMAIYFEIQGLYEEAAGSFEAAIAALQREKADASLLCAQLLIQQGRFARLRSHYEPAKAALTQALALIESQKLDEEVEGKAQVAEALHNLGLLAHYLGDNRLAPQQLEKGIALCRTLNRPWLLAEGLGFLALVTEFGGQPAIARQLFQESLTIRRSIHDLRGMAMTMSQLGFLYVNSTDYARAELMFQECLAIQRELGDHLGVANTLNSLGAGATTSGNYVAARQYHSESLAIYRQYNEQGGVLRNLGNLGYVYNRLGDYQAALDMSLQALAMDRVIGSPRSMVFTLRHLGESYLHLGDLQQSRRHYHQALVMAQDIEETPLILLVLNAMAALWIRSGQPVQAVERLSFILNHPASEGKVLAQAQRQMNELAAQLPVEEVAQAQAIGRAARLEDVVASVLHGE